MVGFSFSSRLIGRLFSFPLLFDFSPLSPASALPPRTFPPDAAPSPAPNLPAGQVTRPPPASWGSGRDGKFRHAARFPFARLSLLRFPPIALTPVNAPSHRHARQAHQIASQPGPPVLLPILPLRGSPSPLDHPRARHGNATRKKRETPPATPHSTHTMHTREERRRTEQGGKGEDGGGECLSGGLAGLSFLFRTSIPFLLSPSTPSSPRRFPA